MMKKNSSYMALGISIITLCLVPFSVSAKITDLLEMSEKADQADKQDFYVVLNQANSCTLARNFSCSEDQLRKAAKLANGNSDRQALNSAKSNLQAERQRVKAEAEAKAENERQIRLAEERAEENRRAEKRRRQREEAEAYSAPSTNSASSQLQQSQRNLEALFSTTNKQLQDNTNRAFQQQRDQAADRQREANEDRARENERTRLQNQRAAQQAQEEQARQQEQARARQARENYDRDQAQLAREREKKAALEAASQNSMHKTCGELLDAAGPGDGKTARGCSK